jgi:hypothetical protein
MSTPESDPKTEPPGAPERRIRRGCLPIIVLLLMVAVFNLLQYGVNAIAIVAGALCLVAVAAYVVISRG